MQKESILELSLSKFDITNIYGDFLNNSFEYLKSNVLDNDRLPLAIDVLEEIYLKKMGGFKVNDFTKNFSNEEKLFFDNFAYIDSIESLNLRTLFDISSDVLRPLRESLLPYSNKVETEIKNYLSSKLKVYNNLDYSLSTRIKSDNSILFSRIITLTKISEIPDIIGCRIVMNKAEMVKELKNSLLDSNDSPLVLNMNIQSHVWRNETGYRDTINCVSQNYQSFDMFVLLRGESSSNLFHNIDFQIRNKQNEIKINLSSANHIVYKNKQLYRFLLQFLFDKDYREKTIAHSYSLLEEIYLLGL